MLWAVFTLLTVLFWGIGNVIDKIMIAKIMKNPLSYFILTTIYQSFFILLIFLVVQPVFNLNLFLLSIVSGFLGSLAFLFYLFSLQLEDVSKIIPLSYLGNIFTVIFSYFLLKETFGIVKYFGIALLITGAIILSYKKSKHGSLELTPAIVYILLSCIVFAAGTVFNKYVLNFIDPLTLVIWGMLGGYIIPCILIFKSKIRIDFLKIIKIKNKFHLIAAFNQMFSVLGFIALLIALSLGTATLVSSLSVVKPLVILLLTVTLSIFFPKILKEDLNRKNMTIKIFSIILIMIGALITII